MSKVSDGVRLCRSLCKILFGSLPICLPFFRRRFAYAVTRQSDLVIEGPPRSATAFSAGYLRLSQERELTIAHSNHVPVQITYALKHRIPCVVLVRNPLDAVASYCIASPWIPPWVGLLRYILFYLPLRKHRQSLLLGDFETVTRDFNIIIRRINAHSQLDLDDAAPHDEVAAKVFDWMKQLASNLGYAETKFQGPSEEKAARKARIHPRIASSRLLPLATRLYESFREGCITSGSPES